MKFPRNHAALKASAAAAVVGIALLSTSAFAQDTTASTDDSAKEADAIVVTGSLLRRTDTETPSPVTVLTQDTLLRAGLTNVNDAIRSVSADGAGSISTGFQNGFSGGGAAVSLRGLGVSSTLVMIDGLRSANFPLNDDGHNAYVDLNSIPFSLIDRVEVLKDGASSTYGADAIGGVVNLILKKHVTGVQGTVEGGVTEKGDAGHQRYSLTAGYGDYEDKGFNIFISGEYSHDKAIESRGFPYNTSDLSSIGGKDQNTGDSSITTQSASAIVIRAGQTDLNNPLSGTAGNLGDTFQLINPATCTTGFFNTPAGVSPSGTGCKHDLMKEWSTILPDQKRYSLSGRVSVRLADNVEAYISGVWSHSEIYNIGRGGGSPGTNPGPNVIRTTQPFGGSPSLASSNPGIVLPVYICASGVNCATAANRTLNPNNPYASAYANDPANGAARIYYQFADIPFNFTRKNDLYRINAGFSGNFADTWNWRVEGVFARDNFSITDRGYINIANLLKAINTGSYNFFDPSKNTTAVRQFVSPDRTTPSHSTLASIDASISHSFADLPGGPLQVLVGGQVRRETLENNSRNADLAYYTLTTSAAFGKHTVAAGFFEIDAPVLDQLDINASGRYDHYSEGFSHFSPKVGVKFTPMKELALRGTFSKGFRAPTFGESGPRSSFAGCSTFTPTDIRPSPGAPTFGESHGGSSNGYANGYSACTGITGNPNLKPEQSRSFTAGAVFQPTRWFSLTVDYYNVKKTDVIVQGPLGGDARNAYYAATTAAQGCANVAAIGAGYSCNVVDAPDPLFPNALPRVLIINAPFVNAGSQITSGMDITATVSLPLSDSVKWTSRLEVTDIFKYNLDPGDGQPIQKFVGTMGPYELSSGAGTPKWRGNWQNSLEVGKFTATLTAYYVSKIMQVAADEGQGKVPGLTCADDNLGGTGDAFCYAKRFIDLDLNASLKVTDNFMFYANVSNLLNAKAPVVPQSYSGINYLPTWHMNGVIGRAFRAGANFKF